MSELNNTSASETQSKTGESKMENIRIDGKQLTAQGTAIVIAIRDGLAQMTPTRWAEVREAAAQNEDEGEWFAPEFAEARAATEGIEWDFDGWENALGYLVDGSGRLGGVSMLVSQGASADATPQAGPK